MISIHWPLGYKPSMLPLRHPADLVNHCILFAEPILMTNNITLVLLQNSEHFLYTPWYWDSVPGLHELRIISMASVEKPSLCNFVRILDRELNAVSCEEGEFVPDLRAS